VLPSHPATHRTQYTSGLSSDVEHSLAMSETVSITGHKEIPEILLPPGVESQDSEDWDGEGGGKGKVRLVRSHAIRDSASPPPPGHGSAPPGPISEGGSERSLGSDVGEGGEGIGGDTISVTDSGRGDTDTPDGEVYTDSTGTDLTQFIINTLNKNTKDRVLMLKLELEMTSLVKDIKKTHHKFPHMSSYHRMLVHRVAAYFGLDHNVDQSGNCVIVNKTKNTRLPEMKFREHIIVGEEGNGTAGGEQQQAPLKLKLMKRESCSCDSGDRQSDTSSRRSKSIEEREEEYEKARRRIFNERGERLVLHSDQRLHCLASTKGANQARSFDIRESLTGPADRPAVSKSFSFGGYPAPQHLEPRKQAPSPHQYRASPPALLKGQVVWAVSDVTTVPPGSVLINPDSGTPYLNSDGSVYLFDPGNPPRLDPHAPPYHGHATPPNHHPGLATPPQDLVGAACDLSKLTLEMDQMSVGSMGSHTSLTSNPSHPTSQPMYPAQWMVQGSPALSRLPTPQPQPSPAPYILVNPVSSVPLPHYIPYLSHPTPMPTTPPRPLLFSLHRSPPHSLVLFLQHCPSVLTRAQLTSFLDSFLGPAAPQLHGGQWQFLDQGGVWGELLSLPPDTPTTNRFPTQIYFENEEQASTTVQALRSVGFLPLEQGQE